MIYAFMFGGPQIQGSKPSSTDLKKREREERKKEGRKGGREGRKNKFSDLLCSQNQKAKTPNNNTICKIFIITD